MNFTDSDLPGSCVATPPVSGGSNGTGPTTFLLRDGLITSPRISG